MDTKKETAEQNLLKMLEVAGLVVKPSFLPGEVQKILGISPRTFWRYTSSYEPDENGEPADPRSLNSFMLRTNRRVPYHELLNFLVRNQTYERINGVDPRQMELW